MNDTATQDRVRCFRCDRDVPWEAMTERCERAPDAGPHEGVMPLGRRRAGWSTHIARCPHAHPIVVGHNEVDAACTCRRSDGIARLVEAEQRLERNADRTYGRNGGVPCDTFSGPCNCGAWH